MVRRHSLLFFLSVIVLVLSGCFPSTAIVPEYMTVSPHLLTYAPGETIHTMALTHSCSCPITWTVLPTPNTPWLQVGTSHVGDVDHDTVRVDRTQLTQDTSRALLQISSGEYKTQSGDLYDTVMVVVYR